MQSTPSKRYQQLQAEDHYPLASLVVAGRGEKDHFGEHFVSAIIFACGEVLKRVVLCCLSPVARADCYAGRAWDEQPQPGR
jgi:hypothetical protein